MHTSVLSTLLATLSTAAAVYQGFNYGSTYTDGSAVVQSGFEAYFNTAKGLVGQTGAFSSARLYTMVQAGTSNGVTQAIPAAINTETTLLLGLWASAGQADFDNELAALRAAIQQYGTAFTDLVAGISVGSEDLYRNSPIGIINKSGYGAQPADLVSYIQQVRALITGTVASGLTIGHVDTWTAWVNGSNDAVIANCDWLGVDAYPYFQGADIASGNATFFEAYYNTVGASTGKPVWITETGWPVSGPTLSAGVPSLTNARTYWEQTACTVFGHINTWWYTLQDSYPYLPDPTGAPSFGIVGSTLSDTPLYDLSCPSSSAALPSSTSTVAKPSTSATVATFSATSVSLSSTDTSLVGTASLTSEVVNPTGSETPIPVPSVMSSSAIAVSYPTSTDSAVQTAVPTTAEYAITSVAYPTSTEPATPSTTEVPPPATSQPGDCTTDILSGTYEFPHLIVPVSSTSPDTAYGTSYFGMINSTVSSIFNFDIPSSDAGKTCTLVFLLPLQSDLQTSSFTISGAGGIRVRELSAPATMATTYSTIPSYLGLDITISSVIPGNSYTIGSHACGAGERISFELSATGSLNLEYFQDYNPAPIGFYDSVC